MNQHDIEGHRARIRLSETYLTRQLTACEEIFSLAQGLLPEHSFPDMDWWDATARMAREMERIEIDARNLYTKHFAVLPASVAQHLISASGNAAEAKFLPEEVVDNSSDAHKLIGSVFESLNAAATDLKSELDGHRHPLLMPALQAKAGVRK
ncbi:hypothetical protein [Longimicrobium sp.]|jgi:hypothetical protein|uniref:hypothetical protein n=1 Tax=Longimicrobium sp. TaxID=2029185 RepID=UPI002F928EE2